MSEELVAVRKDHLETLLENLRWRCFSCGAPATRAHNHERCCDVCRAYVCDEHVVGDGSHLLEDIAPSEAIRATRTARPVVASRAVPCPYGGIAFKKVPGYVSGHGCPVCKGLGEHQALHGSNEPCDLTDIEHAVDHIKLLKGRIEKAIEVSDNDGGSASDAIQDMLYVLMNEGEYFGEPG